MTTKAELAREFKWWREDPVNMVHELFQVKPDAWQADGLRAFATDPRIAVKSATRPLLRDRGRRP